VSAEGKGGRGPGRAGYFPPWRGKKGGRGGLSFWTEKGRRDASRQLRGTEKGAHSVEKKEGEVSLSSLTSKKREKKVTFLFRKRRKKEEKGWVWITRVGCKGGGGKAYSPALVIHKRKGEEKKKGEGAPGTLRQKDTAQTVPATRE